MTMTKTRDQVLKLKTEGKNCLPAQTKVVQRFGSMVNHTLYGQCVFQAERESLIDTAKVLYCRKLLGENSALTPTTETAAAKSSLPSPHNVLDKGWALRSTKTSKPFSEKQRGFLEEKFTIGETTGRKLDPVTVARQMRVARGSDGQRQFTPEELLTANQIQGFFPAAQNLRIKQ